MKAIARSLLTASAKCLHCNGIANIEYVNDGLIGAHVCPGRYVSRIMAYGDQLDPNEFKRFVQEAVYGMEQVEGSDVRMASRYAWDLGLDRESNDLIMKEVYWTQNYRRTKNDSPNRQALFLCSNRDSFFVQPLNSSDKLCQNCRK